MTEQFFSIGFMVKDQEAFQAFAKQITEAMAKDQHFNGAIVVACGFDPECDSLTKADIFQSALMEMNVDIDDLLAESLADESSLDD